MTDDVKVSREEWISVEDRLPEVGLAVLVALAFPSGGHSVRVGAVGPKYSRYGVNYGDAWGYGSGWDNTFLNPVTHWMHLPDPPKALNALKAGEK